MKEDVYNFLQNLPRKPAEQFNQALLLYGKAPYKNPNLHNYYNRAGYTNINLQGLLHDLKVAFNITDTEFAQARRKKKLEQSTKLQSPPVPTLGTIFETANDDVKIGLKISQEFPFLSDSDCPDKLKVLVADKVVACGSFINTHKEVFIKVDDNGTKKSLSEEEIFELAKKTLDNLELKLDKEVLEQLNHYKENKTLLEKAPIIPEEPSVTLETIFETANDDVKIGLKTRQEFPFLSDPDCPDKLKILIADKITAYEKFVDTHKELFTKVADDTTKELVSEEEIFILAEKAVRNFELNREIYDELNHYQEHKEILGKHPIFTNENLKKEIESMSASELAKSITNLRASISKEKSKLKRMKKEETKKKYEDKIETFETKLKLVQERLNAK